ncbi:MAG: NADH-quinone oxidoreductase subunit NuoK [Pseudomonadota bacterium]
MNNFTSLSAIDFYNFDIMHYLVLSALMFVIGLCGIFINRRHVISILMSVELMLLAVNINFVTFSNFLGDLNGQAFTFFILTVAAAEAAIGLAIMVICFRDRGSIDANKFTNLQG